MECVVGFLLTVFRLLHAGELCYVVEDVPAELDLLTHEAGAFRRGKASESIIQNFLDLVIVFFFSRLPESKYVAWECFGDKEMSVQCSSLRKKFKWNVLKK